MTVFRMGEAADLLGVSTDTLRRWADAGKVETVLLPNGRQGVDGTVLAALVQKAGDPAFPKTLAKQSARNRFRGIVTKVTRDTVMAQVEMQAGPFRVVSLMSREAADDLGLEPGMLAVAAVKSTNVVVEVPEGADLMRAVGLGSVLCVLLVGCGGGPATGPPASSPSAGSADLSGTVTVLAAASLTETFMELGEIFERQHPRTRLQFSFSASSELATQVVNGAPADLFAAASRSTMQQVVAAGAVAAEPTVFARNRLQIAVPPDNPGDVTRLSDFARGELAIALCAPEVPCGAAAIDALESAGVTPSMDTLEQDVKSALTKVELGEVDAALVYRTDVQAAGGRVMGIDFPQAAEAVNDYPIAVLAEAPNPAAAKAFAALVTSTHGRQVLVDAGFQRP